MRLNLHFFIKMLTYKNGFIKMLWQVQFSESVYTLCMLYKNILSILVLTYFHNSSFELSEDSFDNKTEFSVSLT